MPDLGPATYRDAVEWTLRAPRSGESRSFTQTELSIDGEAAMLGLVQSAGQALTERDFPWAELNKLFDTSQPDLDWDAATRMLGIVAAELPDVVVKSTAILFGLFERDEDGQPIATYEADLKFLRRSINFSRWVEVLRVFASQNDYQRLALPFGRALGMGAPMLKDLTAPTSSPATVPSPEASTS